MRTLGVALAASVLALPATLTAQAQQKVSS